MPYSFLWLIARQNLELSFLDPGTRKEAKRVTFVSFMCLLGWLEDSGKGNRMPWHSHLLTFPCGRYLVGVIQGIHTVKSQGKAFTESVWLRDLSVTEKSVCLGGFSYTPFFLWPAQSILKRYLLKWGRVRGIGGVTYNFYDNHGV